MKDILDQEIKWCRANHGVSDKGKLFEDGFIAGLKQAKLLYAAQQGVQRTAGIVARRCRSKRSLAWAKVSGGNTRRSAKPKKSPMKGITDGSLPFGLRILRINS